MERAVEPDAPHAFDKDAQRPVGDLDHLVDHGGRADPVEIVPAGLLGFLVLHRHEREHPVAGDDVLDDLDRALLPDRERRREAWKDDGVFQRQHRQRRREGELVLLLVGALCDHFGHQDRLTAIETLSRGAGRGAIGSLTVRMPRSYVATASSGSMSSSSVICRWNGP